jgi:PAS domain S-box-containing protein
MKVFLKSPLSRKLVLTMMATSSASLLIASLSFLSYDFFTFRQNLAEQLEILANITGSNVAAAITYHDPKSAEVVLNALRIEPQIVASRVFRADGTLLASYREFPSSNDQLPGRPPPVGTNLESTRVTICQPIVFDEEVVGYVYLESNLRELQSREERLGVFVLILTLVCSAAAFFVALFLKRIICTPIFDLVHTTRVLSSTRNYGIRSRKFADDELGLLVDGFNTMLEEIEKRESELKSEVGVRTTAEQMLRDREAQLQLLLDSTAEAIYGIDLEGRCTFSNRSCLRMLGFSRSDEMLGKNIHTLIHHSRPDGSPYPSEECPTSLTMKSGTEIHTDREILWRADKTAFPIEAWSHPVWKDGTLAGGVVTFIDITERELSHNELRAAHAESELFINSVPSILIGLNREGRIIRWNSAAAIAFGLKVGEVMGQQLATCGIRWVAQDIGGQIHTLLAADLPMKWDDVLFEKDIGQRLLGLTATRIALQDTGEVMYLIVGADITDRRRAEEELHSKTAFLEAQTHATPDGILVLDENGNRLLQNHKFLEMFNIPEWVNKEADEKSLLDYVLPEIRNPEEFIRQLQYINSHKEYTVRDEVEFNNGKIFDRYSAAVVGKGGIHYGRIWTFRDITERKRNEETVRRLSLAVEQSPVSIVITDLEGNITYVNRRFTESSGYTSDEVLGKNPRILKSEQAPQPKFKEMWESITHGREWRGEFRNRRKDGELLWESVVISPIKDAAGHPTHFLAFQEDVTERRNMELQMQQAQKLEAIGQLAAGIAHEINTPIQFIGDNLRFVQEAWVSLDPVISMLRPLFRAPQQEALPDGLMNQFSTALATLDLEYLRQELPQAITQSLDGIVRVAKIVLAMKEFSHPGSDEKQPADINKAILTTLTVARNEWKYVSEVETLLAEDLALVPCHISEISQVILNLIVNSAHAISQVIGDGSRGLGKITVQSTQENGWVMISICDTGTGIAPENQSRIFEPFFTTKGVGKGTGQGLAIAHNTIVKKHGGRLWFESEPNKGTTFFIQLPISGAN